MSKSVLVIDTPENCIDCIFCQEYGIGSRKYACCYVTNGDSENDMKLIDCIYGYRQSKPDWCPLKPLPEKREYIVPIDNVESQKDIIAVGWNACINKITGGDSDD